MEARSGRVRAGSEVGRDPEWDCYWMISCFENNSLKKKRGSFEGYRKTTTCGRHEGPTQRSDGNHFKGIV